MTLFGLISLFIIGAVGSFLFLYFKNKPRAHYLAIQESDPLMEEAYQKVAASLDKFWAHAQSTAMESCFVKLKIKTPTELSEYAWAQFLAVHEKNKDACVVKLHSNLSDNSIKVGDLLICSKKDIKDWQIFADDGLVYGGFTQRAMYEIAKRDGLPIPKNLAKFHHKYAPF